MDMGEMGAEPGVEKRTAAEQKDAGQAQPGAGESNALKDVMDGAKKLKGVFGF
jgi:hypothetical protein